MTNFGDSGRPSLPQKHTACARGGGGQFPRTGLEDASEEQVVVQVGADPGKIFEDVDAERCEVPRRTEAGVHEDLRRLDRPEAEHDLPFGPEPHETPVRDGLDADRATAFEQHAGDVCPRPHRQVALPAPWGEQRAVR